MMHEAVELMAVMRDGIATDTALAIELVSVAGMLDANGQDGEAAAIRSIVHPHRAQAIKLTALLGGLEARYGFTERAFD